MENNVVVKTVPPLALKISDEGAPLGRKNKLFEDRYHALGRATGSMVWTVEPGGMRGQISDWTVVTGQSVEDSRKRGWLNMIHPDDREQTQRVWLEAVERETPYSTEYRIQTADGSYRWYRARGVPIFNEDGSAREWVGLCEDIHDRTLAEKEQQDSAEALRHSEERYRQTFDNAAVAIAHVGLNGRWLEFNDAICQIVGYSREELLQKTFADITHPNDLGEDWKLARRLARGELSTYTMEKRYIHKNGDPVWVNLTVSLLRDSTGAPLHYISIIENIDARKRAEQALRDSEDHYRQNLERLVAERTAELNEANAALTEARDAALAASKTKSEFLANMSHEFRTPMNGVLGLTSLLRQMNLEADAHEIVETISSSGETLLRVIDDILDLSRIDAARLEIERVRVELDNLCSDVVALFQGHAQSKGLRLRCIPPGGKIPRVLADSVRLRQVLSNLIANGVKFTEKGEVSLNWEWERQVDGVRVWFTVNDTGAGIPQDRTEAVFESFTQADGSTQRKFGGTGLGLTISKRLVELMGGSISVKSQLGSGTAFVVDLTFELDAAFDAEEGTPSMSVQDPSNGKLRVLLAEDNSVNVLVARRLLEHCGCHVVVAENGLRAISLASSGDYDLILMDVQMPVCDGLEATRVIRAAQEREGRKRLPVYALTANVMSSDREDCLLAGMDGFLAKPIPLAALQALISDVRASLVEA